MPAPWISLLVLHVLILAMGSAVFWSSERWPKTALLVSALVAAVGVWALWSASDNISAHGLEAGERLFVVGRWLIALGIAGGGLIFVIRKNHGTSCAFLGPRGWFEALVAYWFMSFAIALFEGMITFLGTTPHGQFR